MPNGHPHGQPPHAAHAHDSQCTCGSTRRGFLRHAYTAALLPLASAVVLSACHTKGNSFSVRGGELRPVVNPARYNNPRVRALYAQAHAHREVLDKLFCYCYCNRAPFLHKSLLSCFVDDHGAGCGICLDQAEWAVQWKREGKTLDEIRALTDRKFA